MEPDGVGWDYVLEHRECESKRNKPPLHTSNKPRARSTYKAPPLEPHDDGHAGSEPNAAPSANTFSNDGSEVIARVIGTEAQPRPSLTTQQILKVYEIQRCAEVISKKGYSEVALQFSDSLLPDAAAVATQLQAATNKNFYILGDTSYGSCCVDEVAAEHADADIVIHYGKSCLSEVSRLPVMYVFGRLPIDLEQCATSLQRFLKKENGEKAVVFYDVEYDYCIPALKEFFVAFPNVVWSELAVTQATIDDNDDDNNDGGDNTTTTTTNNNNNNNNNNNSDTCSNNNIIGNTSNANVNTNACNNTTNDDTNDTTDKNEKHTATMNDNDDDNDNNYNNNDNTNDNDTDNDTSVEKRFGRCFTLPRNEDLTSYPMFFIGAHSQTLTNHMFFYNENHFFSYDPSANVAVEETLNTNKMLMRRYFLMQKARDADVVGILAGTLGVKGTVDTINSLGKLCRMAGKKFYTFVIGKINVAKLANFMEIDIFVLVACPENSLIDSKEFYRPVVTPYELQRACLPSKEWMSDKYELELRRIMPELAHDLEAEEADVNKSDDDESETQFSFISGTYRSSQRQTTETIVGEDGVLVKRNTDSTLAQLPSATFLANRTFSGLERKLGETAVSKAVEGRTGIASDYQELSSKQPL